MFKTLLTASACLLIATPAFATSSLSGEIRIGDVLDNRTDSTEYKVEYWDTGNTLNFGAELQVKQPEDEGAVSSKISVKAGPALPSVLGVTPTVYGEFGRSLSENRSFNFWGAGAKASMPVYGPVSISVGYRHREGFDIEQINEERLNGGISVAVSDNYTLGAQYYRTRGSSDSDTVGLSVTRKF